MLDQSRWNEIPADEKLRLMDRAIDRLDTDQKKQFLLENRQLLLDGRADRWGMHYHEL